MNMVGAITACLKRYVEFSGRSSRSEYWWFWLACMLAGLAASVLDLVLFGGARTAVVEAAPAGGDGVFAYVAAAETGGPISAATALGTLVPLLAAGWRRMHDVGRRGWLSVLHYAIFLAGFPLALVGGGLILEVVGLAALIAAVWVLVQLARRGDPAPNGYGLPPVA